MRAAHHAADLGVTRQTLHSPVNNRNLARDRSPRCKRRSAACWSSGGAWLPNYDLAQIRQDGIRVKTYRSS